MITVIGVRFRNAGKIYYFDPGEDSIARGMSVIVETARGMEMGMVMLPNTEVEEDKVVLPLKPVIRIATTEDFDLVRENKKKEKEAFQICRQKIQEHQLEMKLVDVEYTFDGNKVLFYFTADGRIDFRELVKDLASVFKTRIELRQIGVRDETKIMGGIGICGRSLCCHSYLSEFIPVSIKMAKEQNLSLNPTKISGVCGRLMCCLKNEEDTYEYLNKQLPRIGEMATVTEEGEEGEVQSVNVLRQRVKLLVKTGNDDTEVKEYPVEELDFGPNRKPPVHREEFRPLLPEGGEDAEQAARSEATHSSRRGRDNGTARETESGRRHRERPVRNDASRSERRNGNESGRNRNAEKTEGRDRRSSRNSRRTNRNPEENTQSAEKRETASHARRGGQSGSGAAGHFGRTNRTGSGAGGNHANTGGNHFHNKNTSAKPAEQENTNHGNRNSRRRHWAERKQPTGEKSEK